MTDRVPLKTLFSGSTPVGLGEYNVGDTTGIEHGGTGKTSIAANKIWYATTSNVLAETDLTAAARTFIGLADVSAMRSNLGLVIGTNTGQVITAVSNGRLPALDARNLTNTLPAGLIMMWSGNIASIPANFRLCDGANGTPDLRDKFIVGAGLSYVPGANGGATTHTHTVTVQNTTLTISTMPSHNHQAFSWPQNRFDNNGTYASLARRDGGGQYLDMTTSNVPGISYQGGDGSHGHGATVSTASNLPPYYALAYVMSVLI